MSQLIIIFYMVTRKFVANCAKRKEERECIGLCPENSDNRITKIYINGIQIAHIHQNLLYIAHIQAVVLSIPIHTFYQF